MQSPIVSPIVHNPNIYTSQLIKKKTKRKLEICNVALDVYKIRNLINLNSEWVMDDNIKDFKCSTSIVRNEVVEFLFGMLQTELQL